LKTRKKKEEHDHGIRLKYHFFFILAQSGKEVDVRMGASCRVGYEKMGGREGREDT